MRSAFNFLSHRTRSRLWEHITLLKILFHRGMLLMCVWFHPPANLGYAKENFSTQIITFHSASPWGNNLLGATTILGPEEVFVFTLNLCRPVGSQVLLESCPQDTSHLVLSLPVFCHCFERQQHYKTKPGKQSHIPPLLNPTLTASLFLQSCEAQHHLLVLSLGPI